MLPMILNPSSPFALSLSKGLIGTSNRPPPGHGAVFRWTLPHRDAPALADGRNGAGVGGASGMLPMIPNPSSPFALSLSKGLSHATPALFAKLRAIGDTSATRTRGGRWAE